MHRRFNIFKRVHSFKTVFFRLLHWITTINRFLLKICYSSSSFFTKMAKLSSKSKPKRKANSATKSRSTVRKTTVRKTTVKKTTKKPRARQTAKPKTMPKAKPVKRKTPKSTTKTRKSVTVRISVRQ